MKHSFKAKGPKASHSGKKGKKHDIHKQAAEPMKKAGELHKAAVKAVQPLMPAPKPIGGNSLQWDAKKKPVDFGADRGVFAFK